MTDTIDHAVMRAELIRDESSRLRVYDDATGQAIVPGSHVAGHPTIGVGRSLDLDGLRQEEVEAMLDNDVAEYLEELSALAWFLTLDPVRRRAIINMRHTLGLRGLLAFAHMIDAIQRHDYAAAADEMTASHWAKQAPQRAERCASLLRDGDPTAQTKTV